MSVIKIDNDLQIHMPIQLEIFWFLILPMFLESLGQVFFKPPELAEGRIQKMILYKFCFFFIERRHFRPVRKKKMLLN